MSNAFENDLIKRNVLNQRLLGTLRNILTNQDSQLEKELLAYISKHEIKTKREINNLKKIVNKFYTGDDLSEIKQEFQEVLTDFALAEAEQLEKSFNKATIKSITATGLTASQASTLVSSSFVVNQTVNEFLDNYAYKQREEIVKLARLAYSQGLTQQELSNLIIGTKDFNYNNGFFNKRAKTAQTIARTTLNGVANSARESFYKNNSKYIAGEKINVTFDSRTSPICQAYGAEDKVYNVGEAPVPPFHPNCRSTIIPVIKDEYDIFTQGKTKPAVGSDGVEQIPRNQRYDTFLKNQSVEFQKEALGATKYRLFKNGVELEKFVDSSGKPLSVAQLKVKYDELL
ncbi:minor capsid protein [Francisella marina]|uniref:minor capsid protein n=1 Tax=Francisella marina TaxID=2249302 RepID=UPI0011EE9E8A|nr:minor capsid protein [Francisella marina]QEO58313.1 hypothetical protein F0R75_00450 [Francisella marina]